MLDGALTSLQGVGRLTKLRELVTDGCPVRELSDLRFCLELRRLSLLGSSVEDFSAVHPLIHLTEVAVSNANLDSLGEIFGRSALTSLQLENCDLRGRFFKRFDSERRLVKLRLEGCALSSTELTLLDSGAGLDWSLLARLPALSRVTVDETTRDAVLRALQGTDVTVTEIGG